MTERTVTDGDLARAIIADPEPIVGDDLRLLRHLLKLTQRDLAEAIGSTRVTVCKWERHRHRPRRATELRLRALVARRFELLDPAAVACGG